MSDLKSFGIYLSKVREQSGYKSQRQLALDAKISPATLSRIEGGTQKATHETLKKLAPFLKDVSYEDLLEKAGVLDEPLVPENLSFKPSSRDMKDLAKMLEQQEVQFHGVPLSEGDKQRILGFMESMFWEAKEMNKRKKKKSDNE